MDFLKGEPYHISIEVVNKDCKGLKSIHDLGISKYKLKDIRGFPDGPTRHLVKIPSEQLKKISRDNFTEVTKEEAWIESDGCDVCNAILSNSSFLVSASHIEDYKIIYSFVVPNYESFQNIISIMENKGLEPNILNVSKFKTKGDVLTEKQDRTLWLAFKLGFFEYPRKINSIQLSQKLGIVPSTFSEIKRRGLRKILEKYFET